jgi:hypothetical protein
MLAPYLNRSPATVAQLTLGSKMGSNVQFFCQTRPEADQGPTARGLTVAQSAFGGRTSAEFIRNWFCMRSPRGFALHASSRYALLAECGLT